MKTLAAPLLAHYESGSTTTAYLLRLTRADAEVFGFTSHDQDVSLSGVTYAAGTLVVSAVATSADFAVDNLNLSTIDDGSTFNRNDVLGGIWNGARYLLSRYNWATPANGTEALSAGTVGNVEFKRGQVDVELRSLKQYLQQPVGEVSTKTCRARLGDARCTVNLAPYTFDGTVTAVASSTEFTASVGGSPTPIDDYFGEGLLTWETGANVAMQQRVRSYTLAGVFGLALPMPEEVQVGDTFSVVAGCRKRLSDCRDKFDNVLNFQGEPHRPNTDSVTSSPEPQG